MCSQPLFTGVPNNNVLCPIVDNQWKHGLYKDVARVVFNRGQSNLSNMKKQIDEEQCNNTNHTFLKCKCKPNCGLLIRACF